MNEMSVTEENAAWAREILADPTTAVLDTETTGLRGYACEISVFDGTEFLLNTLVNPGVPVEAGAFGVHGLSNDRLASEAPFKDIWPDLEKILNTRRIVVWNAEFDSAVIRRELIRLGVDLTWEFRWECAMIRYSDWLAGYDDARYQRLNGGHRAGEDCRAVFDRLREMAAQTS